MRTRSFRRISSTVWMVVRFILQIYRFYIFHSRIWDEQDKQEWEALLSKQAKEYRRMAVKKGGLLIKFGQFLSSRADLLPQVFIDEMETLVDRVKPGNFSRAEAILKEELGARYQELKHLNSRAIAAASIGEVYEAELEDGTKVAVKVQRHNVREIFHMDFKALRIIVWILRRFTKAGKQSDLKALYAEVVTIIGRELDFKKELEYAQYFSTRLKENDTIQVPHYYETLCTDKVLVMDWIDGRKITDLEFMEEHQIPRERVAKSLFSFFADQYLNSGLFHADPHAGNIMLQQDGTIVLLDFGMVGEITSADTGYLRDIIQGILLDDYDEVIEALHKMEFLLDDADTEKVKKIIRKTADMYKGGQLSAGDMEAVMQLMEELQVIVKEQPIQLPADYAFLGRAASVALGLISIIYPEADLVEWGRPVMLRWMRGSKRHSSIYTGVAASYLKPFLSMPRAVVEWLTDGEEQRTWERHKQKNQFMHQFYFFYTITLFVLTAAGVYGGIMGISLHKLWLVIVCFSLGLIFFVLWLVVVIRHILLLRSITKTRR